MARTKDYKAKTSEISTGLGAELGPSDAMLALPPNPRNHKEIDLSSWLGHGFDDWVWAAITILKARLQSGNYSVATIGSFASNGIKVFLPYLLKNFESSVPLRPADLTPADVARYVTWLKRKYPNPDGQVKFPHPWPPQIPPGRTTRL